MDRPNGWRSFRIIPRVFWPGSDAPDGKFNFINMGGKVMFRNDD